MVNKNTIQEPVGISDHYKQNAIKDIETLLIDTKREGINNVVSWIQDNNFYYMPASNDNHNSFRGGLLSHSLNVAHIALKAWESDIKKNKYTIDEVPHDSVVIASLLHDICKCLVYSYNGKRWIKDIKQYDRGHGTRSVEIITKEIGFHLTKQEIIAIKYHDKSIDIDYTRDPDFKSKCDEFYAVEPLLKLVHRADNVSHSDENEAQRGGYFCPLHYIENPVSPIIVAGKEPKPFELDYIADSVNNFSCVGLGDICLDTVIRKDCAKEFSHKGKDTIILQEVGGGMANVMCNMSYLGWNAYPIALLDYSKVSKKIKEDLERFGVNNKLVAICDDGKAYIKQYVHYYDKSGNHEGKYGQIKVHAGKLDSAGNAQLHISYRQISSRGNTVDNILSQIDFVPNVFFFDSVNTGHRMIAKEMHNRGALVYFEPTNRNDKKEDIIKCTTLSHIIKVSDNDFPNIEDFVENMSDKLVIQTLGVNGCRFNLFNHGWVNISSVANDYVIDSIGAGDITTSVFLSKLAKSGCLSADLFTTEKVFQSLSEAMVYASYSVSFLGAKSMWYADPNCKAAPNTNADAIEKRKVKSNKKTNSFENVVEYSKNSCLAYNSRFEIDKGIEKKIAKNEISVLSNFYICKMPFGGLKFNSAEQLYHYLKFDEQPELQQEIMKQTTGKDIMMLCKGKKGGAKHEANRWKYMTLAMEVKYLHCKEFRERLIATGDMPLVELQTKKFDIFGATADGTDPKVRKHYKSRDVSGLYIGLNGCGRCMMAVRDKFKGVDIEKYLQENPYNSFEEWNDYSPIP